MILGTCSVCGGAVSVPDVWFGVIPPVPTCSSCGATKRGHGPVIDMEPNRRTTAIGTWITGDSVNPVAEKAARDLAKK